MQRRVKMYPYTYRHHQTTSPKTAFAPIIVAIMASSTMLAYAATLPFVFIASFIGFNIAAALSFRAFFQAKGFKVKLWHIVAFAGLFIWLFLLGGMATLGGWFGGTGDQAPLAGIQAPSVGQQASFIPYAIGWQYTETNAGNGASLTTSTPQYNVIPSGGKALAAIQTLFGVAGTPIASGTTSTNIPVSVSDNGIQYLNIDSGTTDYPDPAQIRNSQSNSYINDCYWKPYTSRNVNELVCEVSVPKTSPNANDPVPVQNRLAVRAWPDDVALTLSAPADQTGISTTAGTPFTVTWTITDQADNQGSVFARLYITSNQTTATITIKDVTIESALGVVDMFNSRNLGTAPVFVPQATGFTSGGIAQTWQIFPLGTVEASDYSRGLLIGRSGTADSIRITLNGWTSFPVASDGENIVMNYRLISAGNALQTAVSDTVLLSS